VGGAPGSSLALQSLRGPAGRQHEGVAGESTPARALVRSASLTARFARAATRAAGRRATRILTCRRLRHARAERRHGVPRHEGGARAASPPRLGPRASGAPPARRRRALGGARARRAIQTAAPRPCGGGWVVRALRRNYLRLAPQNLGEYQVIDLEGHVY